jgi:Zn ribbon nucleic-acid-binding protein
MARYLRHEACPKCNSRDNLACYDDESKWCFGCGYYVPPEGMPLDKIKNQLQPDLKHDRSHVNVELPRDCTFMLPKIALAWLKQYGLTNEEISKHRFMWSQEIRSLIFPVYSNRDEVIFWQAREFPTNPARKYRTEGNTKAFTYIIHARHKEDRSYGELSPPTILAGALSECTPSGSHCCVVEDAISGIRVGRVTDSIPLFGSSLNGKQARSLSKHYDALFLWLDPDKRSTALKTAMHYGWLFKNGIRVIQSSKDPKEHSDSEIRAYIAACS